MTSIFSYENSESELPIQELNNLSIATKIYKNWFKCPFKKDIKNYIAIFSHFNQQCCVVSKIVGFRTGNERQSFQERNYRDSMSILKKNLTRIQFVDDPSKAFDQ